MYPVTVNGKAFFEQVRKAILVDDAGLLAKLISFPLTIRPDARSLKLENEAEVKKNSALIFTP